MARATKLPDTLGRGLVAALLVSGWLAVILAVVTSTSRSQKARGVPPATPRKIKPSITMSQTAKPLPQPSSQPADPAAEVVELANIYCFWVNTRKDLAPHILSTREEQLFRRRNGIPVISNEEDAASARSTAEMIIADLKERRKRLAHVRRLYERDQTSIFKARFLVGEREMRQVTSCWTFPFEQVRDRIMALPAEHRKAAAAIPEILPFIEAALKEPRTQSPVLRVGKRTSFAR